MENHSESMGHWPWTMAYDWSGLELEMSGTSAEVQNEHRTLKSGAQ